MDIQTQKLDLIEEVMRLQSSALLTQLGRYLAMLKRHSVAADDLPLMPFRDETEMKARFEQSLRELKNGEGIPHEQVEAKMRQRFKQ